MPLFFAVFFCRYDVFMPCHDAATIIFRRQLISLTFHYAMRGARRARRVTRVQRTRMQPDAKTYAS